VGQKFSFKRNPALRANWYCQTAPLFLPASEATGSWWCIVCLGSDTSNPFSTESWLTNAIKRARLSRLHPTMGPRTTS
jgi:hypothetical protein